MITNQSSPQFDTTLGRALQRAMCLHRSCATKRCEEDSTKGCVPNGIDIMSHLVHCHAHHRTKTLRSFTREPKQQSTSLFIIYSKARCIQTKCPANISKFIFVTPLLPNSNMTTHPSRHTDTHRSTNTHRAPRIRTNKPSHPFTRPPLLSGPKPHQSLPGNRIILP